LISKLLRPDDEDLIAEKEIFTICE